jgi:ligand-binding sensor domain-containing protein
MKKTAMVCILIALAITNLLWAVNYSPGDWVVFGNFRYVTSIAADQKIVYFGTTGGIIRYDRIYQKWLDPLPTGDGLPSNYIYQLTYDPAFNELWADTRNGVAKYNLTFERWYAESEFPKNKTVNDWKASRFPSLFAPFRYYYQNGYISDPSSRNHKITVGWRDQVNDFMYIGTWGMGPAIVDTRQMTIALMPYGPFNGNISQVTKIDHYLWMGTDYSRTERGLTRYNISSGQWSYFEPETQFDLSDADLAAAITSGDNTWLGTKRGLLSFNGQEEFKTYISFSGLPSDNVLSLALYGGFIYVGTDKGLGVLPESGIISDSTYKSPLPSEYLFANQIINALLVYNNGLYIATDKEVYSYDSDSRKIQTLDTPAGDLAAGATDIFNEQHRLYFAVSDGVVIIDMDKKTSKLATDPEYANRWHIYQVVADSQFIWCATSIGLWRYKKYDGSSYLYTVADGLPTNKINSIVMDGDYLWLGSELSLIRFYWNSPGRGD